MTARAWVITFILYAIVGVAAKYWPLTEPVDLSTFPALEDCHD